MLRASSLCFYVVISYQRSVANLINLNITLLHFCGMSALVHGHWNAERSAMLTSVKKCRRITPSMPEAPQSIETEVSVSYLFLACLYDLRILLLPPPSK